MPAVSSNIATFFVVGTVAMLRHPKARNEERIEILVLLSAWARDVDDVSRTGGQMRSPLSGESVDIMMRRD